MRLLNVYVAGNNQVIEYPSPGYSTTVTIGRDYSNPTGIAVDASGAVYVADSGNARIVRVAPGGASQSALAFTGLSSPQGVAVDSAGNVYVVDGGNVYEVNRTQAAALAFASTYVGSTSAPQSLTVSNAGNQQLNVTNVATSASFTLFFRRNDLHIHYAAIFFGTMLHRSRAGSYGERHADRLAHPHRQCAE